MCVHPVPPNRRNRMNPLRARDDSAQTSGNGSPAAPWSDGVGPRGCRGSTTVAARHVGLATGQALAPSHDGAGRAWAWWRWRAAEQAMRGARRRGSAWSGEQCLGQALSTAGREQGGASASTAG